MPLPLGTLQFQGCGHKINPPSDLFLSQICKHLKKNAPIYLLVTFWYVGSTHWSQSIMDTGDFQARWQRIL